MIKKEIIDFYFPILKKHKSLFLLLAFDGIISGLVGVIMPVLLKAETDQLVGKNSLDIFDMHFGAFQVFILILLVILIVNIIDNLLSSITRIFSDSKKDLLENEIQLSLFKKMEEMEIGKTLSSRYKLISGIVEEKFRSLKDLFINLPKNSLEFIIKVLGITIVYAYFNITLLFVVVVSSVISYLISITSDKINRKYELERNFNTGRQMYKYSGLFMYNFNDLAISGGISSTLKNYEKLLSENNKLGVKKDFVELSRSIRRLLNSNLLDIILKLIVGYGVFAGTNSVGMVALVVSSMGVVKDIFNTIFEIKTEYKNFEFSQNSILLMFDLCKPIGNVEFKNTFDKIEFRNINFSYPSLAKYEENYIKMLQKYIIGTKLGESRLDRKIKELLETIEEDKKANYPIILNDLSITFEKGKVYGVVGKNGAGKTTLMHLLSGFFRNYSGDIFVNGELSKDFTSTSFSSKISFLTQVPYLLDRDFTIRENLLLGVDRNINDEEIFEYLEKFGLAKKIKKLKKGLDSEIGRDVEFSGGEKQILVFIRILLQNRDIIIMDEGTNQLDAENEIIVMNELLKQKSDKIIIFITHRMSTISKADEIYCLEDGNFKHYGKHKDLLEKDDNIYARFYKAQILV
ncbi:MAG: ATP-binding cassette domain-containing protein [Candidatus Gracilibacteria bacterium]|nr:ATP-binding cassette domain-containing protein [Candidatus Gracilibacteria bacterium]